MPTIYLLAAIPGCACGQCSRRWACTPCSHPWSGRARGTARRSRSTSTWTEQGMMGLNMSTDILGKNSVRVYGKCFLLLSFEEDRTNHTVLYSVFKFYFSVFLWRKGKTTYFPVFSWEEDRTVTVPFPFPFLLVINLFCVLLLGQKMFWYRRNRNDCPFF